MSFIPRIRSYLKDYYPELIEQPDQTDEYYFESRSTFNGYPSLVAVSIDDAVQTITLQVMIGTFFKDVPSDAEKHRVINELNQSYKFVSFSEINGALNMEHHLLTSAAEEPLPPIMEYLLLLTAAADDVTRK